MSLAKRAGAITTEIFLGILPDMAVVPADPHGPTCSNMVDLGGIN
jgi:hypothetical protein